MRVTRYRFVFLTAAFGLLSACVVLETQQLQEPVVAATPAKPVARTPAPALANPAPAPVKKKPPVIIDFNEGGSGGGGWG